MGSVPLGDEPDGLNQRDTQQSTLRSIERSARALYGGAVRAVSPRETPSRIERREAPRFPVVLAVKLEHGEGRTRDVSATGVFFTTQERFSLDDRITLALELEHADPDGVLHIVCEGTVVRVEPRPDAVGVAVCICAYDFTGGRMSGTGR